MDFSDSAQDCLDRAMEKHQTERNLLTKCAEDLEERESAASQSSDSCFDCNICLIFAVDPVVTLCGHLYCWTCIYKWLEVESAAARECPVCKAPLSRNTLIPLYGCGCPDKSGKANLEIPRRSSLPHRAMIAAVLASRSPATNQERYGDHLSREPTQLRLFHSGHGDFYVAASPVSRSTASRVFGGLAAVVLPWTSSTRNHEATTVHASPSLWRRVEDYLHQIWLVLFVCVVVRFLFF